VSASVYIVYESKIIQLSPVAVDEVVSERTLLLLIFGEIGNDHYDAA
jgi:hypothetical protein